MKVSVSFLLGLALVTLGFCQAPKFEPRFNLSNSTEQVVANSVQREMDKTPRELVPSVWGGTACYAPEPKEFWSRGIRQINDSFSDGWWARNANPKGSHLATANSIEAGARVNGSIVGRWGMPILITVAVGATIYLIFISRGR